MHQDTKLVTTGRAAAKAAGIVNTPVYHASTVLFPSIAAMQEAVKTPLAGFTYGRNGTPSTFALEEALAEIEGGDKAIACPSGQSALITALTALTKVGDHLLVVDTVYDPVRAFLNNVLTRFGVEVTYFPPTMAGDISTLIRKETKAVLCEAPGSHSFEMQDIPAIAAAAHAAGAIVMMDNTWATPLYFRPFEHGVDISLQAATKYIVGHSDVEMGAIILHGGTLSDSEGSCAFDRRLRGAGRCVSDVARAANFVGAHAAALRDRADPGALVEGAAGDRGGAASGTAGVPGP
jgi:cystathionine beta-lyase